MNAPPDPRRVLKFGVFEVDLRKRELRRSGSRQKLGPQAFQVLEALLERPGELITREELRQQLWPASPFIDHELGLKKCVSRIREVLGDSADNPRFVETVPRCGYRFIAPVEQIVALGAAAGADVVQASITMAQIQSVDTPSMADVEIPPSAEVRTRWRKGWSNRRKVWVLAALASAAFVSIWLGSANRVGSRMRAGGSNEQEVLPLTSVDGEQMLPAFSPDGSRVAFLRRASRRKESGIYLAVVGEQSLLKLTEDEDAYSPTWSPDGRRVAFLRDQGQNFLIQTVPALGGAAKAIYAGARAPLSYETGSGGLSFSPDGELLAFSELNAATQRASIKLLSLRDSTARFLTSPPPGSHDRRAAFSPTGDRVAFIRSSGPTSVEEVFLISAGGGEPRQLTFDHKLIFGPPTWTRNGEEIIFSSNRRGPAALWRISVAGGVPLRVPGAGPIATDPTASLSGKELAYEHTDEEENLWRLPLRDATHARPPASVVVSSAKSQNLLPQFSADGRKIAFQSERSGYSEIWIYESDGSGATQVTDLRGFAGSPRWSPDGRYLAFDYRPQLHTEIYIVETGGGRPHVLAAVPNADNLLPSWSRDGKWVYFTSNRGAAGYQIWKMAVKDGTAMPTGPMQVTRNGGFGAVEAPDGRELFYTRPGTEGVWAISRDGGGESAVWKGPGPDYWSNWAITREGLYFFAERRDLPPEIDYLDFRTRRVSRIGELDEPSFYGLTVSPDGGSLVYSQWDRNEHDIRVIENFR